MRIDLPKFGIHAQSHDYGDGQNAYVDNAPLMKQMAAGRPLAIRDIWQWPVIESEPGKYNWSETDRAVDTADRYGHRLIACLYGAPVWSNSQKNFRCAPDDRSLWPKFLSRVAQRYGDLPQIAAWEIWNEPDTFDFWMMNTDTWETRAAEYGRVILDPAIRVLKKESPKIPIISGGLSSQWYDQYRMSYSAKFWLPKALATCSSRRWLDGVGFHPYLPANEMQNAVKQLKDVMAAYGLQGRDIIGTEYSAKTNAETKALRELNDAIAHSDIKCACVHYAVAAEGRDYGMFKDKKLTNNGLLMQEYIRGNR